MRLSAGALTVLALLGTECGGTTGGHLIQVPFEAGGIARDTTSPFTFPTGQQWSVTLTQAEVVLGPLYFNIAAPQPSVFRSGVVIMQVTSQFVVDMLDPTLQPVAGGADGQTGTAISVEIGFYTSVNGYNDTIAPGAPLVASGQQGTAFLAGTATATKSGVTVPFAGRVQITSALVTALNPIDRLARAAGADCDLTFTSSSGPLQLRVDPRHWFDQANFCNLVTPPPRPAATDGGVADAAAVDATAADAVGADGGSTGAPAAGEPCSPSPGTVYGWSDSNPFNSAVLGGMKGSVGVYSFSLGP